MDSELPPDLQEIIERVSATNGDPHAVKQMMAEFAVTAAAASAFAGGAQRVEHDAIMDSGTSDIEKIRVAAAATAAGHDWATAIIQDSFASFLLGTGKSGNK